MSFSAISKNNNTTTATKTASDITSFNNIVQEITTKWNEITNNIKVINEDIKHLERMFNLYNNADLLYQTKNYLISYKNELEQKQLFIENEMFQSKNKLITI